MPFVPGTKYRHMAPLEVSRVLAAVAWLIAFAVALGDLAASILVLPPGVLYRKGIRLCDVFVDRFIASFGEPPSQTTLDIDPFDDPTHGDQQLTFFHGYYGQYQYLPRAITCAENDNQSSRASYRASPTRAGRTFKQLAIS